MAKKKMKEKKELLKESLRATQKYLKQEDADINIAGNYLIELGKWATEPEAQTESSGSNPGSPPPPPPGTPTPP